MWPASLPSWRQGSASPPLSTPLFGPGAPQTSLSSLPFSPARSPLKAPALVLRLLFVNYLLVGFCAGDSSLDTWSTSVPSLSLGSRGEGAKAWGNWK